MNAFAAKDSKKWWKAPKRHLLRIQWVVSFLFLMKTLRRAVRACTSWIRLIVCLRESPWTKLISTKCLLIYTSSKICSNFVCQKYQMTLLAHDGIFCNRRRRFFCIFQNFIVFLSLAPPSVKHYTDFKVVPRFILCWLHEYLKVI